MKFFTRILVFLLITVTVWRSFAQTNDPRPNIVIILVDDMIWNTTGATGEISEFKTPNIDRIANEGINIRYYSTNSICIPGRASLLTGLYGHKSGAVCNSGGLSWNFPTIATLLHKYGYYTALDGKYMISSSTPKPGYDYWFCTPNAGYINDTCNFMGTKQIFTKHITAITTDTAVALIRRVHSPFFILVSHNATHIPYQPMPEFYGSMNNTFFYAQKNFERFTKDYPSFLYDKDQRIISDELEFLSVKRKYYEVLSGVEQSVGEIYNALQQTGQLDNTLLIFTSDNGFTIGAHQLWGKRKPYEEIMRMPLLIRYPKWFSPHSSFDKEFVINTDLFPTMLEAAGIKDTVKHDGYSILSLINGSEHRDRFLYEQYPEYIPAITRPVSKTIRTKYFQYTRYYCVDTTEELFDMVNDSLQMINLARHPEYEDVLIDYRYKLDSLRIALNDTANIPYDFPCFLRTDLISDSGINANNAEIKAFPTPASQEVFIFVPKEYENATIEMFNGVGEITQPIIEVLSSRFLVLKISSLPKGIYFLRFRTDKNIQTVKVVVAR